MNNVEPRNIKTHLDIDQTSDDFPKIDSNNDNITK